MRVLVLAIALACLPAFAQFSGRLSGTVQDASGAPVPGAAVNLYLAGGAKPLLTTKTAGDGAWHFIGVRPTDYDIAVDARGFASASLRGVTVDPANETDVPPITLQLATISQSVNVTADAQKVETGNAEISDTIDVEQIQKLPVLDRDPLYLLQTLPGVVYNGNTTTTIDGLRTSFSNMTLDGINIQDNYIRDNALDYTPNKILLGQIRGFTSVTSNQNAAASGGATQLAFETPSGTNSFHGEVLYYNRNNALAANDWFNNQAGVPLPGLNQNQAGFSIGGPIRKDKLFFYGNYELVRTDQQTPVEDTILTSTARQGIFTYQPSGSNSTKQINLLTLRNIQIDPYMQNLLSQVPGGGSINDYQVGDSAPGNLRNTAGYRFNQRDNEVRDNVTFRMDYDFSPKHVFTGTYAWNRDTVDNTVNDFSAIPQTTNPNHSNFLSLGWRWTPSGSLTNELRGGFNLAPGDFLTSQKFGPYIVTGMAFNDPVSESLPQGRATNTYSISDNAAWQKGHHYIQFGGTYQKITVHAYDDSGIIPTYNLFMGEGQPALTQADLPGISAQDLANANTLLATLGGYVDSYSQTLNVTSRTSGFVPGAGNVRNFRIGNAALYVQDNWKVRPRITATIGLRWELPGVADEANSLELLPEIQGNPVQTLLSNATLNFAGSSVGHPWYARDWKDFGPNVGLAWDVFGNGKTSFRSGYSIAYVNDQALVAPENMVEANSGLIGLAQDSGLSGRVSSSLPAIIPPVYQIPVTVADNYATNPFNNVGLIDPNLRTPYVQQWNITLQQEFLHTVFEVRYVGNHMVGGYRAFDYNQVNINASGFLPDFLRAQQNGLLAMAQNGVFNPAFNPRIKGSQQLPVFNQLVQGGFLSDPDVRNLIETGQVGQLAEVYEVNGLNGNVTFFPNPKALGTDMLNNYSNSTYNGLQVVVRHRAKSGLDFSANYTYAKVLSDTAGDLQSRIEQFLDINNPSLERARADFDLRHSIKGTGIYDLPMGSGHRINSRRFEKLLGGWSVGAVMSWQSGAPFSVLSGLGTFNRSDNSRSYYNTADTSLTMPELENVVRFQMTGNGPYMVAPSAINPVDGTGTNGQGVQLTTPFHGQVFNNPQAGTLGTLQRRAFSGPWAFNLDASLQKNIRITEHQSIEVRMEGTNITNHPTFYVGDQNINSTTFGAVASMLNGPRIMQFGAKYTF
jgi:hypothetical protein